MIVRQFLPMDLMMIALQPHQRALTAEVATPQYAEQLAAHGEAYTVAADGDVVAVIGLIHQWDGCSRAYAFMGENAGRHMLSITRQVRDYLARCKVRRIEAAVQDDFTAGHKWAKALGFRVEGQMRKYWNEHDALLYARVQ